MRPTAIFQYLTPRDDPKKLPIWRERIAGALTVQAFFLFLIMAMFVDVGLDPPRVDWRFMEVAAADETHDELKDDIAIIRGDLAAIQTDVSGLAESDRERAERERQREIREVRTAILELQLRQCMANGSLRAALAQQVGQLRSDYMALTGEEFPATPCSDLLGAE